MVDVTRRTLCEGLMALSVLAITNTNVFAATARPRPNILFLIADDWSWQNSEAVDKLGLNLPTFERIKRSGVNFPNAFTAAPTCTASRGSILTGKPIYQLEQGANLAGTLSSKLLTYTDILKDNGYYVGFSGKGWAPGKTEPGGRSQNPAGARYKNFDTFMAERPKDTPFCFWYGSPEPHRPFTTGEGVKKGIKVKDNGVPNYLPDNQIVRDDIADYIDAAQIFDKNCGDILNKLEKEGLLDNTVVVITGDNGWAFPRAKATLYDAGTHVPLAIMWNNVIKPSRTNDSLVSLTDLAPTFLEAAGVNPPSSMVGKSLLPTLQYDQPHRESVITAMERHMDGGEVPLETYPIRALRTHQYLYIKNFEPNRWPAGKPGKDNVTFKEYANKVYSGYANIDASPTKAFIITEKDKKEIEPFYTLATGKRPNVELYDILKDPDQLNNLAQNKEYAGVLEQLDTQLMTTLKEHGDPRATGNGNIFDTYPTYSDPGFGRPDNY